MGIIKNLVDFYVISKKVFILFEYRVVENIKFINKDLSLTGFVFLFLGWKRFVFYFLFKCGKCL